MRVELSTTYKQFLSAEEAIVEIYPMGFDHMQLGAIHESADIEKIKKIKEHLHLNFSMHAPFPNPNNVEINPKKIKASREALKTSIENAHQLGAGPIVFHPGSFNKDEVDMENYYNLVGEVCDMASNYGITMCIENKGMHSKFGRKAEELLKVLEKVNAKNLKICFDSSHARNVSSNQDDVLKFFDKVKDKVGAIHLVDTHSEKDDHLPPSFGKVMTENIISKCSEMGYKGPLTFEVTHVPDEMIVEAHEFVRGVISENYFNKITE